MLGNIGIKPKLIGAFILVAVVTGITGGVGILYTESVGDDGVRASEELAPLVDAAMEVKLTGG